MDFHWPLVFHSPLLSPLPTLPPESQLFPHPENTPRHGCHLRSRGRGPIDPNWKCHFSALPNCQDVHPTLDRGAERAALSCTNCTALRAALYPSKHTHTHTSSCLLRWGGIEKGGPVSGSSLSARSLSTAVQKSRSQHGSEPSGTDCCRTSRLLQTRVDPGTVCPAFLVHPFSLSHTHIDTLHIFSVNSLGSGFIDYEEDLNSSTVSVPLKYLLYKHSTPPSLEAARRMLKNTAC